MTWIISPALALACVLARAGTLQAQQLPARFGPLRGPMLVLSPPSRIGARASIGATEGKERLAAIPREYLTSNRATPDYRWEGLAVGGVLLGVAGGILLSGFCETSDNPGSTCLLPIVGGVAMGGTVGAVIGGMIGSLFPKAAGP